MPALSVLQRGAFELELLDSIPNLIAIEPEHRGGPGLDPAAALERLDDQRTFELLEVDPLRRKLNPFGQFGRRASGQREVPVRQLVALGEQHRPLDRVSQLADVARPGVGLQALHRLRRYAADALAELRVVAV